MTKIAVIGLGYVGLNIAAAFGQKNAVIGFDTDKDRIKQLATHHDRYNSVSVAELQSANIAYSSDEACLEQADFYIIAVPTPVDANNQPDLKFLESASRSIGKYIKKNDVIVNESTVYPGATDEICIPILEQLSGLKSGVDFFVGYSPERINPGDTVHTIDKIIKIISGQNPEALKRIKAVYDNLSEAGVHVCSSMKAAEAVKVFENTQRDVNIALLNEFAQLTTALNVDIYEIIEGLKTKWNYLDFTPGLVGGHCISVDPYYLTYKARQVGLQMRLIETAREVNNNLSYFIERMMATLATKNPNSQKTIGVFGLTYKEDIPDFRNSLSIDLFKALQSSGHSTFAHDPIIDKDTLFKKIDISLTDFDLLPDLSAIIITKCDTAYKELGLNKICEKLEKNGCLFDMPGMFRQHALARSDVHYEVM
ncbi:MAG: nucleotide sugar dehydrogenase [Pseudomonadota bacterium]|nr:nucleotide sugar dehydrogenase [Pseudomonadota bacterium]